MGGFDDLVRDMLD